MHMESHRNGDGAGSLVHQRQPRPPNSSRKRGVFLYPNPKTQRHRSAGAFDHRFSRVSRDMMESPKNYRGAMGLHTYPIQPAGPSDRWLSPRVPRMNLRPMLTKRTHAHTREPGDTRRTSDPTVPTRASFLRRASRHHGVSRISLPAPKIISRGRKKCLHYPPRFAIILSVESEGRVSNFNRWRSLPSLPSLTTGDYRYAR